MIFYKLTFEIELGLNIVILQKKYKSRSTFCVHYPYSQLAKLRRRRAASYDYEVPFIGYNKTDGIDH